MDHVSSSGRRPAGHSTKSTVVSLTTGTGQEVFESLIIPRILSARNEVVLTTCFWASSSTRDAVREALIALSNKAVSENRKVEVQICFSSSSLARNMLWPTPNEGEIYRQTKWAKLGLPESKDIPGLDLMVIRKFFWPFGIIHSKYVIVDKELAIFPSCNVSWEEWFEVGVTMTGPVVRDLMAFHNSFWSTSDTERTIPESSSTSIERGQDEPCNHDHGHNGDCDHDDNESDISAPTILLPSPHQSTMIPFWFRPESLLRKCSCIPIQSDRSKHEFSQTPLLLTTHHLLSTARSSITILTPNLTEPVVLESLNDALNRGVRVLVWTNRKLMTAEQIVTAGTTTPNCVNKLKNMSRKSKGQLTINFFDDHVRQKQQQQQQQQQQHEIRHDNHSTTTSTPIKLHSKVTIVDDTKLLLGSCNMDAASWRTSQELGVLIESKDIIERFKKEWIKYGVI